MGTARRRLPRNNYLDESAYENAITDVLRELCELDCGMEKIREMYSHNGSIIYFIEAKLKAKLCQETVMSSCQSGFCPIHGVFFRFGEREKYDIVMKTVGNFIDHRGSDQEHLAADVFRSETTHYLWHPTVDQVKKIKAHLKKEYGETDDAMTWEKMRQNRAECKGSLACYSDDCIIHGRRYRTFWA